MTRTQMILMGLLLVQALLLIFGASGTSAVSEPEEARELVENGSKLTSQATKVRIEDGEGKVSTLAGSGQSWTVADADGYPADGQKVVDMLSKLEQLEIRRAEVNNSKYFASLKVSEDDFERHLQVWVSGQEDPALDLYIGSSPNYRISYVRKAGEDNVYPVANMAAFDYRADAMAYVEARYAETEYDDLLELTVENQQGRFHLKRDGDAWQLVEPSIEDGRELDQSKASSLGRSACSFWLSQPIGKVDEAAQGLDQPAAKLTLVRKTGEVPAENEGDPPTIESEELVIRIGKELEGSEGERFISRSGFEFAAAVREYAAQRFVEEGLDENLKEPEPPVESETESTEESSAEGAQPEGAENESESGEESPGSEEEGGSD